MGGFGAGENDFRTVEKQAGTNVEGGLLHISEGAGAHVRARLLGTAVTANGSVGATVVPTTHDAFYAAGNVPRCATAPRGVASF